MKRRLLIIGIFLLLGAVVNVAVAWGCAAWLDPLRGSGRVSGYTWLELERLGVTVKGDTRIWGVTATPGPGYGYVDSFTQPVPDDSIRSAMLRGNNRPAESAIPPWSDLVRPDLGDPATLPRRFQSALGWPWLALTFHGVFKEQTRGGNPQPQICGGVVLYRPQVGVIRALPFLPMWAGFLANSTFYAAILWLLIPGPFALRRFLRVRRGLCPKCAYPMGESAVCTECGKPLPTRVRVA